MSATAPTKPTLADVDFLVDESGNAIQLEHDSKIVVADEQHETIGATGPNNWFLIGLCALFVLAGILLAVQVLSGNKGTAVYPGTPVAAPQGVVSGQ